MTVIKVYVSPVLNSKTVELLGFLDDKEVTYEVEQVSSGWAFIHKVKSLPVVEIDGEIIPMKKIMKRLKKG